MRLMIYGVIFVTLEEFSPPSPLDNQVILAKEKAGGGWGKKQIMAIQISYFSRLLANDTRQMEVFCEFMTILLGNLVKLSPCIQLNYVWIWRECLLFLRIMLGLFKMYPKEKHLCIESLPEHNNLQFAIEFTIFIIPSRNYICLYHIYFSLPHTYHVTNIW